MHRSALSCNRGVVFSLISSCRKLLGPINRPIKIGNFSNKKISFYLHVKYVGMTFLSITSFDFLVSDHF